MHLAGPNGNGVVLHQAGISNAITNGLPIVVDAAPEKIYEEVARDEEEHPQQRAKGEKPQRGSCSLQIDQFGASHSVSDRPPRRSFEQHQIQPYHDHEGANETLIVAKYTDPGG